MRPYSDSPRTQRGVHQRNLRAKGQTPSENFRLEQALRDIIRDLDEEPFNKPGGLGLGPGLGFPIDSPAFRGGQSATGGDASGYKEWSQAVRRRTDRLEDDRYMVEFDEMKEEVQAISTDLELLDWARRRVFTTDTPSTTGSTATTTTAGSNEPIPTTPTSTDMAEPLSFPKPYPQILAHVMRVAREAHNNPHLSLSFFHHARTLSIESYLVGCLSSAYNELIKTRWECFRDLDGVDQAIKEMDANAVSWDMKTQLVVGKIVEEVGREVIQKGPEDWGGERVYEILDRLERKVQAAIRKSEYLDKQAKRAREKKIWTNGPPRF